MSFEFIDADQDTIFKLTKNNMNESQSAKQHPPLDQWLELLEELMAQVDDASSDYGLSDANAQKLERDYRALHAVENVIRNNQIAIKTGKESGNVFQYDIDPERKKWGAYHVQVNGNEAEGIWLGSYNSSGRKLMNDAKPLLKKMGATRIKLTAKWESEGFYEKMNFKRDGETHSDPFTGTTTTDMSKGIDEMNETLQKPNPKDTLGYKRHEMPQVHKQHYPELFKYLADNGGKMTKGMVAATSLKAVQSEFSDDGIEKMMRKGGVTADGTKKPLLVSSDNYIIDGHHRWLAAWNQEETVPIIKISIPVRKLLQLVQDFKHTTYRGIYKEGVQDEKTSKKRRANRNRRTNEQRRPR